MGAMLMLEEAPDRCHSWTRKVRIGGQVVYLTVEEYSDGRPCGLSIVVSKCGTFARGVIDDLAECMSAMLQYGAPVDVVVQSLQDRGGNYSPNGPVEGSPNVTECRSVADWVASELKATYMGCNTGQVPDKTAGEYESGSGW